MYSIGIDIGYSSVEVILMDEANKIKFSRYQMHKGRIKSNLLDILKDMTAFFDSQEIVFGAVTGSGTKFLSADSKIKAVNDVTAVIEGAMAENAKVGSIIDIGGESARFITGLSDKDQSRIEISMNSNCSSGTGSFLEEQMSRLNLKLTDYSKLSKKAKSIPRIAGRCSVFAKTDITHHQQEGIPSADILLGLAYALVRNYKGTVMKKLPVKKPILFSGGVAYNEAILTALKDVLELSEEDLIFPQHLGGVGAFGAAVIAREEVLSINIDKLISLSERADEMMSQEDGIILPKLSAYGTGDSADKHICKDSIMTISKALSDWSPYEKDIDELLRIADRTLGCFSGTHGRYRQAKQLCASQKTDGVITAASIYENTGIVLGMLQKGFEDENTRPVLNLTFDGNKNENDLIKVDSFMYYL